MIIKEKESGDFWNKYFFSGNFIFQSPLGLCVWVHHNLSRGPLVPRYTSILGGARLLSPPVSPEHLLKQTYQFT